jgi:peptidoglycan/LPS O-acetylase OafA/YrhL
MADSLSPVPLLTRGEPGRVHALDGLRGILACIVVAVHVLTIVRPGPWLMLSQIPVALFFVLSGLVLTRAWDGRYGAFLARRFVRLWPVFALSLAAGYALAGTAPVWAEFVWIPWPRYDGDTINGPVWSLFIEAWFAPLMPLIVWGSAGRWRMLGSVAGFLLIGLKVPQLLFGCLFVLGGYLSSGTYRNAWLESRPVQWLGKVSYSLYLTHWLVLKAAAGLVGRWGAVAALPAVFLVAWAVWRVVEQPSIAWSRAVGRALSPSRRTA